MKKKNQPQNSSPYFDILGRLTGVLPHQMSWCCDTRTLMFNKTHLLQNLEASHIPPRLFLFLLLLLLFLLGPIYLRVSGKETVKLYFWKFTWHRIPHPYPLGSAHRHGWRVRCRFAIILEGQSREVYSQPLILRALWRKHNLSWGIPLHCACFALLQYPWSGVSITENALQLLKGRKSIHVEHLLRAHPCGGIRFSPVDFDEHPSCVQTPSSCCGTCMDELTAYKWTEDIHTNNYCTESGSKERRGPSSLVLKT